MSSSGGKTRRSAPLPAAEIRRAAAIQPQPTLYALAARFDCSEASISRILRGKVWPSAGGPIGKARRRGRAKTRGAVVGVRLYGDTLAVIDKLRGAVPRSTWIATAAEERVKRETDTNNPV